MGLAVGKVAVASKVVVLVATVVAAEGATEERLRLTSS